MSRAVMEGTAKRLRMVTPQPWSRPNLVSDAANGFDGVAPELLAQPADIDLDRVAFDLGAELVERFFDLGLADDGIGAAQQSLEHRPLARGQIYGPPGDADGAPRKVD